ncbi:MAG: hypothetical protein FJW35_18495 [Acidobacteria bacterium]|nr:hypothetical protein [Acidobacteriota bacterium]
MKSKIVLAVTALLLVFAAAASAQSLAELAKREKERRAKLKTEGKTITDVEAAKFRGGALTTGTPATAPPDETTGPKPAGAEEADPAAPEQPATDEPVDFQGRPESFWRQTFADMQAKVTKFENSTDVLILKLNDLQNRFYQEADGFKQQRIQQEIQKTLFEQEVNKKELEQARQQLQELETEARKSGALPGWLRTKSP